MLSLNKMLWSFKKAAQKLGGGGWWSWLTEAGGRGGWRRLVAEAGPITFPAVMGNG